MRFDKELLTGFLKARRKRFFADITLGDREEIIAHCPNPGSMLGNAIPGQKVFFYDYGSDYSRQGRKLRYRWILVENAGHLVCVDTSLSNKIVGEALAAQAIPELQGYAEVVPEFTVGKSRLDFLLRGSDGKKTRDCFVEVKSVSLIQENRGYFPDSVTLRGQKHLQELIQLAKQGQRAVIFFVVQTSTVRSFSPADAIDAEYGRLLRLAVAEGVEVLAYNLQIEHCELRLGNACQVIL